MAKLERKAYATYLDSKFANTETPSWFLIGKDIDDMSVELNPDTEVKKNILGETSVQDNGYEPSMSADPYYANKDDSIYPKIKDIAMKRLKGDDCKSKILEVILEGDAPYEAYIEDVVVKPQSYGGDTSGFAIPFDVLFDGNRKQGTVTLDPSTKAPTFSPAEG